MILPSISAIANQGGGNIAIVKLYEKNYISKGLLKNEINKLIAEKDIVKTFNEIYGRRFI